VLALAGFISTKSGETVAQPASATVGILLSFSVVPAVVMLASLLVLRRYDLTAERLAQVVEEAGTGTGIEPVTDPHA
jgi:GPH family glycoside/pentoside/hexuronide:cation symporter